MGVAQDKTFDVVVLDGVHALNALAAAALSLKCILWHALDVAKFCHGNDDVFPLDKFLIGELIVLTDACATFVRIFARYNKKLVFNNAKKLLLVGENRLQIIDFFHKIAIFRLKLFTLQAGKGTKTHVHNGLSLLVGKSEALHQGNFSNGYAFGAANYLNNLVDII